MKSSILLFLAFLSGHSLPAQATFSETERYAYAANSGWLVFRHDRPSSGDGVSVGASHLSGLAYSANLGWINFGNGSPANGIDYQNNIDTDFGVNIDAFGNLSGLAYGANIGWVNFGWAANDDLNRPRVDLTTGALTGFAYSANTGWLNLEPAEGLLVTVVNPNPDNDGLSTFLEFAFGTNPNVSDNNDLVVNGVDDITPGSPVFDVSTFQSSKVQFVRRIDFQNQGLDYSVEFSNDLNIWETDSSTPVSVASEGEYEVVQIPWRFFLSNGKRAYYMRVAVSPSN